MSYIEELRQRVESAERRFGLIDEQERRYSERLIGLMNALEAGQEERQAESAAHQARIAELERENGELRGMLHALLLGVEAGSRETLAGTLRDLDARLSGMVRPAPAADAVADVEAAPDEEAIVEEAIVEEDIADESAAEDAGAAAPVAEDDLTAGEPAIDDMLADDPAADEIVMEELPEAVEDDAVAAAERAVADLLAGGAEGGGEAAVAEEFAMDEVASDDGAGSPVAEMIERLADETQDFPESEPELALDEMAEPAESAPAPKPARKKA